MAGTVVLTEVGADSIVRMVKDRLAYFKFGEGGFVLSNEVIEVVEASASGSEDTYDYIITGGDFSIVGVNPGGKIFTISGEHADLIPDGVQVVVEGSTGNDGRYTVDGTPSEGGGNTLVTVVEVIPDSTVDGDLFVSNLPIARYGVGPIYHALVVQEWDGSEVQRIEDTTGEGDLAGAGGTGTINYKDGTLHVEFASNVGAGNEVRVLYKYHDQPQDAASIGEPLEDLIAADSPLAADGNPSLFSHEKPFGGTGGDPDPLAIIIDRGDGYATIRCTVRLREHEGIDDGRAGSWGGIPFYFELGVYDDNGTLVAYATFDKTRHTGGNIVEHTVDLVI